MAKSKTSRGLWKVEVTFVPFESEAERDLAYKEWVRVFLLGKKGEIEFSKEFETKRKTSREK